MTTQHHWEAVYQRNDADQVSWFRPHLEMILPSNGGHLKNVIRYDEVNHGKIDNINEEKIIYPLLRCLPARSISAC